VRLDLNLASVLEAIMLERSVTRAAASLGMSQPAVSNALRRARRLANDELFIKVPGGVRPTSRMTAMWPDLHKSLTTIQAVIAGQNFNAASDTTTFRAAITDSIASEAVTRIGLKVRAQAPSARVAFSVHTNASSVEGVERGTLDCAVGMFPSVPRSMHVQALVADRYVCVLRKAHPLGSRLSLDNFVTAAHVLVTPSGQELGVVDGWLSLQGRTRNVVMVVNHFSHALRIVAESDLITCVPSQFLAHLRPEQQAQLVTRELPFEAEKILYKMIWHERAHAHSAHQWFRSVMADLCSIREPGAVRSPKARRPA
jgi:DNA-binding transcriptional LysR family regulator